MGTDHSQRTPVQPREVVPLILSRDGDRRGFLNLPLDSRQGRYGSLDEHVARYGTLRTSGTPRATKDITALAERWDIRGRGGAGFPLSKKIYAVYRASVRGKTAVLVANGSESEPLSYKDRALMWFAPHLVLDGMELVARVLGARQAYLTIHPDPEMRIHLENVLAERHRGLGPGVAIQVVELEGSYVSGQETAVIGYLERGVTLPRFQPPRPSTKGMDGRPTQISNVETLARLALAYHCEENGVSKDVGAQSLGSLGTLWTQAGGRVFEMTPGESLGGMLKGMGIEFDDESSMLLGGYFGTFNRTSAPIMEAPISVLGAFGASFGSGVVALFPPGSCVIAEADRVISYMSGESAGQCGPCTFGLPAVAGEFHRLQDGAKADLEKIWRWTGQLPGRGACGLPDGFSNLVRSVIEGFAPEIKAHGSATCRGTDYAIVPAPVPPRRSHARRRSSLHVTG